MCFEPPGFAAALSPIAPPETAGWVTEVVFDIQLERDGTGTGLGWKG